MFRTQSNYIRHLSKEQYAILREMCRYSNNLYNSALYNLRQCYFNEHRFLRYEDNYHLCKYNDNYKMLQAGVSQQILKVADRSFKSFFNLVRKCREGDYQFHNVSIPHYRTKGGLFVLVMSTNAIRIADGYFYVPVSREFCRQHGDVEIRIPFPERLSGKTVKEVRILPVCCGKAFKIQYCYEDQPCEHDLDYNEVMGIDTGVDNLAACVPSCGTPFIIDGRNIKSVNHIWNKKAAYYKGIAYRQGNRSTKRLLGMAEKRNNQITDAMRKAACYIVDYCISNRIGRVVCGYNRYWKQECRMGRAADQNFVQIPHGLFRQLLRYKCEQNGILYAEQEESYTSKASALDGDSIPVYRPGDDTQYLFSGKRICRGLYRTGFGRIVNADCNGAVNIVRKYIADLTCKQNGYIDKINVAGLYKGLLGSPVRIKLL